MMTLVVMAQRPALMPVGQREMLVSKLAMAMARVASLELAVGARPVMQRMVGTSRELVVLVVLMLVARLMMERMQVLVPVPVLVLVLELGLVLLVRLVLRVLVLVPKAQRVMVPVLVLVVPWLALVLKAEQMQPTVRPVSAADLPTWATRAT